MNNDCAQGNHSLTIIYKTSNSPISDDVVRWCSGCGAIVVDIDYDTRTCPGGVMKMRFPKILKNERSN